MSEQLSKLRPDRDLQCYFFEPSAVAALSETSESEFTVSGCWRQQFDWAVIEWNRDNVFEHPALRNLPDGDLSGIQLSYEEMRTNCISIDSTLYPTVDWPYLRIWAESNGIETIYRVPLSNYAVPQGDYIPASVSFELRGTPTAGDYIELAWLDQHFNYVLTVSDTLQSAASALATVIAHNSSIGGVMATASGTEISLQYTGINGTSIGSNANRIGVYGTVHGAGTEAWAPDFGLFSGGVSPQCWQMNLAFRSLHDVNGTLVPTSNVRKLRWTWAADLQPGTFTRGEFAVAVRNWTVAGTNVQYTVAGPGSQRIENDSASVSYQGVWSQDRGNYSGGSIQWTATPGASAQCTYSSLLDHSLYLGTRGLDGGATITVQVDAQAPLTFDLAFAGEDVLMRVPVGTLPGQAAIHAVTVTHAGGTGSYCYFDFLEIAVLTTALPTPSTSVLTSFATDWDTNHSLALAPERTAWLIDSLGFRSRVNHYAGALWFYELNCQEQQYASGSVTFSGTPEFGKTTELSLGPTQITHVNLIGDTAPSMATCFALLINAGSTGVWAEASGAVLTITSRTMASAGNGITISANTNSTQFGAQTSGPALSGGIDGKWLTDLNAMPRINRAARDWSTSFFQALNACGIGVTTSFSMELGNGDDSPAAGLAQRCPNGDAVWLNTPSLQTNFSPVSTAFWRQVYLDMAGIMAGAGLTPYLQFGEVQWWYFADPSGMPFYDAYTTSTFQAAYGRTMAVITSPDADPTQLTGECEFLPAQIGIFTQSVMDFVRQAQPTTKFEVLYAPDTNQTALNQIVNLPRNYWTSANLACFKTENFTYTGNRDLNGARQSIQLPAGLGFPPTQCSHLIGVGDPTTPWAKERQIAIASGVESVVMFALDQYCLIGYNLPLGSGTGRTQFQGS